MQDVGVSHCASVNK